MSAEAAPNQDEITCPSCGAHLKTSLGFIRCPECNAQLKDAPGSRRPRRAFSGIGREEATAQSAIQGVAITSDMGAVGVLRFVAILNLIGGIGIGVLAILAGTKDANGAG